MGKYHKLLHLLPVKTGSATHVKVELYYQIGGMNYFSGSNERRGLYLSVSPVKRTEHEGGSVSESYTAFSGTKSFVKELKRFSEKELNNFKVDALEYDNLLTHVLTKNNITL